MNCSTAAFQICTSSGCTSCALHCSAQGTHSWIAYKFTHDMYLGWEDQTSSFLRTEGWLSLDSSLPLFWKRKESASGKRCPFCLSKINRNNKIRNGLQLLCLRACRSIKIKHLMFLRKARAALPFTLTLSTIAVVFHKQAQQARLCYCWRKRKKAFVMILYLAEFLLRIKPCFLHSLIPWKFFVRNMKRIPCSFLNQLSDSGTKYQHPSILSLELSTWYYILLIVMRVILN